MHGVPADLGLGRRRSGVLAFARTAAGSSVRCLVNLSDGPVPLPEHTEVLIASGPVENGTLPRDTAVWLS